MWRHVPSRILAPLHKGDNHHNGFYSSSVEFYNSNPAAVMKHLNPQCEITAHFLQNKLCLINRQSSGSSKDTHHVPLFRIRKQFMSSLSICFSKTWTSALFESSRFAQSLLSVVSRTWCRAKFHIVYIVCWNVRTMQLITFKTQRNVQRNTHTVKNCQYM